MIMAMQSPWITPLGLLLIIDGVWCALPNCRSAPEYQRLNDQIYPTTTRGAHVWSQCDIPNPLQDWRGCGRGNGTGWLCDPDGVLDEQQFKDIDSALNKSMAETRCRCDAGCSRVKGHPMLVIVVDWMRMSDLTGQSCISGSCGLRYPQLLPGSREPSDQERRIGLRSFGDHILKHWNIGHCQDEVIIIVTAKYRELWVSAGNMAKARLGDILTEEMASVDVDMAEGHVTRSLLHLIDAYTDRLSSTNKWARPLGITIAVLGCLAILFGIVITSVFCYYELSQGKTCYEAYNAMLGGEMALLFGHRRGKRQHDPAPAEGAPLQDKAEPATV